MMNDDLDSDCITESDVEWLEGLAATSDAIISSAQSNSSHENVYSQMLDIEHVESAENSGKRKRKRKYYLVNDFPVIFKNDLRRRYPIMFLNVLNQNDTQLLRQFYDSFASINCRHVSYVPMVVNSLLPGLPTPTTSSTIALFAELRTLTIPDGTVQLEACQIKRWRGQEGCHIDMRVTMKGTKVYEVPTDDMISTSNSPNNENMIKTEMIKKRTLMNMPIEIQAEGLLTLKLDHEHRILEVSLHCSCIFATPVFL